MSAWRADAGVLAMSNLNAFLVELQRGQFSTLAGADVFFCPFGDSSDNLGKVTTMRTSPARHRHPIAPACT